MGNLTPKERSMIPLPKMTTEQAELFWANLTHYERVEFAKMYPQLVSGKLKLVKVNIDEKENITSIILDHKEKPPKPAQPFYKHFRADDPIFN